MRIPRDISSDDLIKTLKKLDYSITRQTGSHIRLTTLKNGEHHVTVPNHSTLRLGTLNSILSDIAEHFTLSKSALCKELFGK